MYSTSTQKQHYTFASSAEISELRKQANERFRLKYASVLEPGEEDVFLTPQEEGTLRSIVTETGIRFAEDFSPSMWHSVRWTAFAYFKRFYLKHSIMEYSPKSVMMGCFYLAAKVDEFNLSIDEFVSNLRSGNAKTNAETILSMEPEIMLKLNYHLTVHCPFRPFEGHLLEMKTHSRSLLGFDLEQVRPHASDFFKKALFGDAMLLYPPSQIALAALKYALRRLEKEDDLLKDQFLYKILEVHTWKPNNTDIDLCEKLLLRLDEVIKCVVDSAVPVTKEDNAALQKRMQRWITSCPELDRRLQLKENANQGENQSTNSDDD